MEEFSKILPLLSLVFITLLSFLVTESYGKILEINQGNIQMNLKKRKFLLLYVSAKSSRQSRLLYPKYIAASQSFDGDKDVIFGRVRDKKLIKEMEIEMFPSIYYYGPSYKEPVRYDGDISVDGITKLVLDKGKQLTYVPKDNQYTVELDTLNFDSVIETPKQFKVVLLYRKEHKVEIKMIEELAAIFQNEDSIVFTRLDVDEQPTLKIRFKMREFPVIYWYKDDEKPVQTRYGGQFDKTILLNFLNKQTGNKFKNDGSLDEKAGLIPEFDKIISDNIENIRDAKNMKYIVTNAKKAADFHRNQEFADYYVSLLERVMEKKSLDAIKSERRDIFIKLGEAKSQRQKIILKKKQNIINFIVDEVGKELFGKDKESPLVQAKDKQKFKLELKEQREKIDLDKEDEEEQARTEDQKSKADEQKPKTDGDTKPDDKSDAKEKKKDKESNDKKHKKEDKDKKKKDTKEKVKHTKKHEEL